MADQQTDHLENAPDDAKPEAPAASPPPRSKESTELTDEQLAKASGGTGANDMKKAIIQNFPR